MGPLRMQSQALWRPRGNAIKPQAVQEEIEASPQCSTTGTGSPGRHRARLLLGAFPQTWTLELGNRNSGQRKF